MSKKFSGIVLIILLAFIISLTSQFSLSCLCTGVGRTETWILGIAGRSFWYTALGHYCFWCTAFPRWEWGWSFITSEWNEGAKSFTPFIQGAYCCFIVLWLKGFNLWLSVGHIKILSQSSILSSKESRDQFGLVLCFVMQLVFERLVTSKSNWSSNNNIWLWIASIWS